MTTMPPVRSAREVVESLSGDRGGASPLAEQLARIEAKLDLLLGRTEPPVVENR